MKSPGSRGTKSDGEVGSKLPPSTDLAIGTVDSSRVRIKRLMSENHVLILSRPSCCMCHVMRSLLTAVGARPTVVELGDDEAAAAAGICGRKFASPALCIGGACVGGLERMVGLHLRNRLVPMLAEVGAVKKENHDMGDGYKIDEL